MAFSTSGTSLKGWQLIGTTSTPDRYFNLRILGVSSTDPLIRRYGWMSVQQLVGGVPYWQVGGAPVWIYGQNVYLPAPYGSSLALYCLWDIEGVSWQSNSG